MHRTAFASLALLALTTVGQAQVYPPQSFGTPYMRPQIGPGYRPAVSPYLNLTRGGGGIAGTLGYYNVARPQQEAFRSLGALQSGYQSLAADQAPGLPGATASMTPTQGQTGHPVQFFYYSHHYTIPPPRIGVGSGGASYLNLTPQSSTFGRAPQSNINLVVGFGSNR